LRAGASLRIADYAGWTPLHEACLEGHTEIVRLMLAFDADVDCPGGDGDTPLHDAVGNVHFEVVKLLLMHGASIDLVNEQGQTALEFAQEKWKESSAEFVYHIDIG
jgi:ankyrin repeat protein